jgi:hypothetical protein
MVKTIQKDSFGLENKSDLFKFESFEKIYHKNYVGVKLVFSFVLKCDDFIKRLEKYKIRKQEKLKDKDELPDTNEDLEIAKIDTSGKLDKPENPYPYRRKQYEQFKLNFQGKDILSFRMVASNTTIGSRKYISADDLFDIDKLIDTLEVDLKKPKH